MKTIKKYINWKVIMIHQILFWLVIILSSLALINNPMEFFTAMKNVNNTDQFLKTIKVSLIGDLISFLMLCFFGFVYYHLSSNSLENLRTSLQKDFYYTFLETFTVVKKIIFIFSLYMILVFQSESIYILYSVNISLGFILILFLLNDIKPIRRVIVYIFFLMSLVFRFEAEFYSVFLYISVLIIFNIILYNQISIKKTFIFIYYSGIILSVISSFKMLDFDNLTTMITTSIGMLLIILQIQPLILLILFIIRYIAIYIPKIITAEYNSATYSKQNRTNEIILKRIFNKYDGMLKTKLQKEINRKIYKDNFYLDQKLSFRNFVKSLDLSGDAKSLIIRDYENEILLYEDIKISRTKNVLSRNINNLAISIIMTLILAILSLLVFNYKLFGDSVDIYYRVLFIFIFTRLMLRAIEICVAFYKDIKPKVILKKTNLLGSERIQLAIFSLIEIIILSSLLYLIPEVLLFNGVENNVIFVKEFIGLFFSSFFNALAVSMFNVSFEYNVNADIFSYAFAQAITHLTQVISSITLISISIANYINLPKQHTNYELSYLDHSYRLLEKTTFNDISKLEKKRELCRAKTIDHLYNEIQLLWSNRSISSIEMEEIFEYIRVAYHKN